MKRPLYASQGEVGLADRCLQALGIKIEIDYKEKIKMLDGYAWYWHRSECGHDHWMSLRSCSDDDSGAEVAELPTKEGT